MLKERNNIRSKHLKRGKRLTFIIVAVGFAVMLILGLYMIRFLENEQSEQETQSTPVSVEQSAD